jgi:serine/threonine-protein kinase
LVHRDVKPANLTVNSRGVVKLHDFGLVRSVSGKAPLATIASAEIATGAADFLAPEQAVDNHGVDSRADIYSLACSLYTTY